MALRKYSLRAARQRPLRVILTFLSIVIGVGAVVAVLLATSTTRAAQREMLRAVSGKADLEIVSDVSGGFEYQLVARVREVPGVAIAAPTVRRLGTLFAGEKKARTQVLGIDPRIDQQIRDYEVTDGRLPDKLNEILLDRSFAKSLDLGVDTEVKLLGAGGLMNFKISGLVDPSGTSSLALTGAAYLVLPAAQRLFRTGNKIDLILVKVSEGVPPEEVAAQLKIALAGTGATVRKPRTSSDMARETMYATENGLFLAVAFALLISAFLIYNTFQMAVGERRKQLGILRAIGATRRQVAQLILWEATVLSIAASVVGCGLGYWGAGFLNGATEQLLQVELPTVHISFWPFAAGCSVGIGVAIVGAMLPARRASRVHPLEAIRDINLADNTEVIRRTWPLGLVLIPLGFLILLVAMNDLLPLGGDVVGIVLILLGCVLLIPAVLQTATEWLVALMRPWIAPEAKLAQRQLLQHIGRSALTVGVLFIAISTCTGMAGNILDNVDNVRAWYSRSIIGDFFVRASLPDFTTGMSADLPPDLEEKLQAVEGVESVAPLRFITAQSGEESVLIVARPLIAESRNYFDLIDAAPGDVIDRMRKGEVVIGSVLAERRKLRVGDTVPISAGEGHLELKIAGIANDYMAGGLTIYMTKEKAEELLGAGGASVYVITARDDRRAEVEQQLQEICRSEGLILQSYAQLVQFIDEMIDGIVASLWMLLALGCIIAAMGLVNTLTMNILEQTREIGMLRVIAMTRPQVRTMIVAQAMQLGILGLVPGAAAGVFVAYAIGQSAMAVLGHDVEFQARPGLVLGCLAFGLLIVLGSSWLPAERAARLKLSDALHYE